MKIGESASVTVAEDTATKTTANQAAGTSGRERTENQAGPLETRAGLLTAQVKGLPEIRQERVAAIATAIQSGAYQVSPEQTAEAILSEQERERVAAA